MRRSNFFKIFHPYFICTLGSLFYVYDFTIRVLAGTISDALMQQYGISAGDLGLLSSFFFLGYMVMQIPSGLLYDRYGPRLLLTVTTFIASIATYFFIATNYFAVGLMARLFMGVGSAFAYIGALFLASRWLPLKYFALAAALIQFMGSIGAIIGEGPLAELVDSYGANQVTAGIALVGVVLAACFWMFIKDYPEEQKEMFELPPSGSFKSIKNVLARGQNWAAALYGFLIWAPVSIFASLWSVPYLEAKYGITNYYAATLTSFIWIGLAFGGPILAWVSAYLNSRKIPLLIGAILGLIASITIIYFANLSLFMIPFALLLYGFASSAQAVTFGLVEDNNSIHYIGTATGFNNMAIVLGGFLFQPLVGYVLNFYDAAGAITHHYTLSAYNYALLILPLCYFVSLVVTLFFIKETHCVHRE